MPTRHASIELGSFLLSRFGRLLLTALLVSTIVFFVVRVLPGDPALVVAGIDASQADVDAIRSRIGTNTPLVRQYLSWIWDLAHLDLGTSFISGQPVAQLIAERFPLTLTIALLGMSLSVCIALPLGVLSAVRRASVWDHLGSVLSQMGMALPSFWLGILLLLAFSVRIRIFPLFGAGTIRHLVLPSIALGIARAAVLLRVTRASVLDELERPYILTARAKGLPEHTVHYKYALKNALLPMITIAGIQLGYMLGGAIIVEQVFSLPGLGRLFLSGIYQRDFPVIQGGVVFVAIAFSVVNFLADIAYGLANPRIRLR